MSSSRNYKIETIAPFRRVAKKLVKKYPSLKNEFVELKNKLKENPQLGTSLGNNCYKIRLAIASKGKGKSGGARVISHFYVREDTVFLLYIYDKSEMKTISENHIKELLEYIQN